MAYLSALFLKAENLFLLKKIDEALVSYDAFLEGGQEHPNFLIAHYRTAQIYHEQEKWEECLTVTESLLEKSPKEKLFAQLSFIIAQFLSLRRMERFCNILETIFGF